MSPRTLICAVRGHAWTTWRHAVLIGARRPTCARCGALKTTEHAAPATLPAAGVNTSTDGSLSLHPGGGRSIVNAEPGRG